MTKISTGSAVDSQPASHIPFALLIFVLAAFGLYAIFVTGPAVRAAAQANLEKTLSEENLAFCEKFGMRAGSSEFAACSQELIAIRKKQTDRDSEAGML
jgi:hypothetical protein